MYILNPHDFGLTLRFGFLGGPELSGSSSSLPHPSEVEVDEVPHHPGLQETHGGQTVYPGTKIKTVIIQAPHKYYAVHLY